MSGSEQPADADPDHMATKLPFPAERREEVLAKIRALPDSTDAYGRNMRRVLLFLYHTGAHPEVLVHPATRRLTVREGYVMWNRPKTGQFVRVPVAREIEPWVGEFVASLRESPDHRYVTMNYTTKAGKPRSRRQDTCYLPLSKAIIRLLERWGVRGSARTFRHDKARRTFLIRKELGDVEKYLGVTPGTALRYVDEPDPAVEEAMREG